MRPAHVGRVEPGPGEGGEVVTRWPYGNVRPDHLLPPIFPAWVYAFKEVRERAPRRFPIFVFPDLVGLGFFIKKF